MTDRADEKLSATLAARYLDADAWIADVGLEGGADASLGGNSAAATPAAPATPAAYGEAGRVPEVWRTLAGRGSVRDFGSRPVPHELIDIIAAVAFSAPSKSDLQQRDLIHVSDPARKRALLDLVADQAWTADVPELLVICGNNARQRALHERTGHPFANDHLDAFFNAAVDAGILLAAFMVAAEAAGLGCCPISALRNQSDTVARLLGLPKHVFPVAGLALGWPAKSAAQTPRLPLAVTYHRDRYDSGAFDAHIKAYDEQRAALRTTTVQRDTARFGTAAVYGWGEDKARQYAMAERADFGAFIRARGFRLA
ncbi:MAG: nitroreductase family protein [Pseudomonadota bacterium]